MADQPTMSAEEKAVREEVTKALTVKEYPPTEGKFIFQVERGQASAAEYQEAVNYVKNHPNAKILRFFTYIKGFIYESDTDKSVFDLKTEPWKSSKLSFPGLKDAEKEKTVRPSSFVRAMLEDPED